MSLSPQFLDELRARTLLSGVIGKQVKLQRAGREWKACCPFHKEKTPSFTVNDEKGFYHCFGCAAHGDAIRFLTDARGLPFMDAVKELADAAGMEVPAPDPRAQQRAERAKDLYDVMEAACRWFEEQLDGIEGRQARNYLQARGITDGTRNRFRFGYAPDTRSKLKTALKEFGSEKLIESGLLIEPDEGKEPYDRFRGRLMIPIRDQRGRVIAFGGRILADGEPKYLNSPETPLFDKGNTLYNLDQAGAPSRESKRIISVEGYLDVIALDQAGIAEAVAPLGTALTEGQLEKLWRLSSAPILCFDGDRAGRKAAVRAALRALPILQGDRTLKFARLPDGFDPDDLIKASGAVGLEAILSSPINLDQIIWEAEQEEADLDTPEGRASFGRRLRDHARSIKDPDVKIQYLAFYKQQVYDLFNPHSRSRVTEGGKWLKKRPSAHPHLAAISSHGMSKAVFAPAALYGLRRFPDIISSHAEVIGKVSYLLLHRDLKIVCREMLDAALGIPDLDVETLESCLQKAGIADILKRLDGRKRVPFSFLRPASNPDQAKRDLEAVLEMIAAAPEVDAALADATQRLGSDGDEQIFAEQIRIRALRDKITSDWMELLEKQYDEVA